MTETRLSPQEYFGSIDADTERLLYVATRGLDAPVPCCPGWRVGDVVSHVAVVYEHKVRVMADNAWPKPWPPSSFADREPIAFLRDATNHLFDEFAVHDVAEETTTFYADDSTVGFWVRRMALEVAVHRVDAELAHDVRTPVEPELAVDGVDEVLRVTLAGPWWDELVTTEYPIDATVAIEAGGHRWRCDLTAKAVTISDDIGSPAAATIGGDAESVFLWLWGRAGDDSVDVAGDRATAADFRRRLAECTG